MPGVKGKSGGHNRKTSAEKERLGIRKDRINGDAPDTVTGDMVIFDDIGENGKKIREQFLPMLQNNGTLSVTDSVAYHKFCRVAEDWFKYDKMCMEKGRMMPVKNASGDVESVIPSPWHKIECDLRAALDVCIRDLGLSPITRDSIKKISTGKPVNRWAIK